MTTTPKKRILEGTVVSDRMTKTRTVAVVRFKKHPKYQKYYKVTTKFKAHDETNQYKAGDVVQIQESHPLSKEKHWIILGKKENKNKVAAADLN